MWQHPGFKFRTQLGFFKPKFNLHDLILIKKPYELTYACNIVRNDYSEK